MSSPREAQLEAQFRKRIRMSLAGVLFKLAPTVAGIPDRLVILPGGRMYLVELKTDSGRLSEIQREWHARVRQLGVHVSVLYGPQDITEWVQDRAREIDDPRRNRRRRTAAY